MPIHVIHSAMPGAPVLTGVAGALIAVLDACLVNGFSTQTPDSIVIAGGVATVTRASGHPFEVDSVATIAGATVTGGSINGDKKVLSVTSTTYTFDATGIANQTATGSPTHKVAPLGLAKQYSGTNLAAYKITDVLGTGALLRVDDTGGVSSRVVAYEAMTDVNTGTGPFPTAAQISGGGHWTKSPTTDATARPWTLVGDSRGFTLTIGHYSTQTVTTWFGDIASRKSPDPYAGHIVCQSAALGTSSSSNVDLFCLYVSSGAGLGYIARGFAGTGSSTPARRSSLTLTVSPDGVQSGGSNFTPFPNPCDNSLLVSPVTLAEVNNVRGVIPGIYFSPQNIGTAIAHREKVTGVTGLTGRKLLALVGGGAGGVGFVDITGPWAR